MKRFLLIDSRFFSSSDQKWKDEIRDVGDGAGLSVMFRHVRKRGSVHDDDLVALFGLAIAVTSLTVAVLQLLQTPKEQWSRKRLLDEVEAFLKLRGVADYRFFMECGFENLSEENGLPCIIGIELADGAHTRVYLAMTKETIQIATVEFDHRELT